jgi:hypothetical protein
MFIFGMKIACRSASSILQVNHMSLKSKLIASVLVAGAALIAGGAQAAPVLQYASTVINFSTQYNASTWAAAQALGAPDRPTYGDIAGAWAPAPQNGSLEFISVGFDTAVYANGATIREVFGNGFVYQVDAIDTLGALHTVWSGVDGSAPGTPVDFALTWNTTSYLVKGLKVYTDTNHNMGAWEEIDSIQLAGDATPAANVPEPATVGLLGLGLFGLAAAQRKRGKRAA